MLPSISFYYYNPKQEKFIFSRTDSGTYITISEEEFKSGWHFLWKKIFDQAIVNYSDEHCDLHSDVDSLRHTHYHFKFKKNIINANDMNRFLEDFNQLWVEVNPNKPSPFVAAEVMDAFQIFLADKTRPQLSDRNQIKTAEGLINSVQQQCVEFNLPFSSKLEAFHAGGYNDFTSRDLSELMASRVPSNNSHYWVGVIVFLILMAVYSYKKMSSSTSRPTYRSFNSAPRENNSVLISASVMDPAGKINKNKIAFH